MWLNVSAFVWTMKSVVIGRIMFKVRCLTVRSQKWGVGVRLPKTEHVQVCSIFKKWCSKPKMGCWSSITKNWTCSSLFDIQKMMFEAKNGVLEFDYKKLNMFKFVRYSKNDVRVCLMSNLVNVVKALLGSMLNVRSFVAKNKRFEFIHQ